MVPDSFKRAIVTHYQETHTPKNDPKNYRPVSGLPFISKLDDSVVAARVINLSIQLILALCTSRHINVNHSTETALLHIENDIQSSLSKGVPSVLILLDHSTAFDTIDHAPLLGLLGHMYGKSGVALKWFVSYLSNRCQSVKI